MEFIPAVGEEEAVEEARERNNRRSMKKCRKILLINDRSSLHYIEKCLLFAPLDQEGNTRRAFVKLVNG